MGNKRFGKPKRHFSPTSQRLTTLVNMLYPSVWCVERCVCVWSSWFSTPTSSLSTAVTFSSVRACIGLPLSCLWSVLPVSRMCFSKVSSPSLLQFIFKNFVSILREPYCLNWCKFEFVFTVLCSALHSTLHYRCSYRLLFYTDTENVSRTKHYLI